MFVSRRVRATSSRPTCWYTTICFRHPCIECSADKILHAVWNRSCFANCYNRQLTENRFHWKHVKHLVIRQAFINDEGTAGKEPLCTEYLKLEQLDIFRHIQHNLAPGGSLSCSHSTDMNTQSCGLNINRFAASIGSIQNNSKT